MMWSHRQVEQDSVPQVSDGSKLVYLIALGSLAALALVEYLIKRLLGLTDAEWDYLLWGVWGLGLVVTISVGLWSRFVKRRSRQR